ncbi:MoaD/ThiS family protein [Fontisphaera persica]|uniref:MoaD/ThiS family protein n=1 Tax=Fontisphaera persica TaxID=2974023 RepID=UPI0024BFBAF5|nr:MoaD/ThiS family protein [Fontisphaera persica]WCJ57975.1 MoaD/ThiS family protein [Fontisphaera persica]
MRILLFAQLKDAAGCAEIQWPAPAALTVSELWEQLLREHPALAPYRPTVRLARNGEYVSAGALFHPGDEVALIPPVSGG